jgi:hypothetical protein
LRSKVESSYVQQIDLRDLESLCQAALDLRRLVDAIREFAPGVTIEPERMRLLELVDGIDVLQGELP